MQFPAANSQLPVQEQILLLVNTWPNNYLIYTLFLLDPEPAEEGKEMICFVLCCILSTRLMEHP